MTDATGRMESWKNLLETIDKKRAETGCPMLGSSIERAILERFCAELERDVLEDAGELEPSLVRRSG